MPRPPSPPLRLGRALLVADERAATLPLRDAFAVELHAALPDDIPATRIDDLAHRLAKVAFASVGSALTALARDI